MRTTKQTLRKQNKEAIAPALLPALRKSGVFFEVLKKSIVPALLLPIVMIWRHLELIGWPSLIWDTLSNSNALLGTLVMGLLISFVLLSAAILPSIVLFPLRPLFVSNTRLPPPVRRFPFALFLTWGLFFGLHAFQAIPRSTWFIVGPTTVLGTIYLWWFRRSFKSSFDPCFLRSSIVLFGAFFLLLCVATLACLASTFPMSSALTFMDVNEQNPYALWSSCAVLVLIAGSSFLPGQILLFGKQNLSDQISGAMGTMTIVVTLWVFIFPHTLDMFTWMTLKASGVYVEEKTPIILQTTKAQEDARKISLIDQQTDATSVIYPFVRFRLGETVLLCANEYAPLKKKIRSRADYPSPIGACAVFNKAEIRQLVLK